MVANERLVTLDLGDGEEALVVAQAVGPQMVSDDKIVAQLSRVTGSIEKIGRDVLDALRRVAPDSASVELSFGLAVQSGVLVTMLAKGQADASIKVTLEWHRSRDGGGGGGAGEGGGG